MRIRLHPWWAAFISTLLFITSLVCTISYQRRVDRLLSYVEPMVTPATNEGEAVNAPEVWIDGSATTKAQAASVLYERKK